MQNYVFFHLEVTSRSQDHGKSYLLVVQSVSLPPRNKIVNQANLKTSGASFPGHLISFRTTPKL